MARAFGFTRNDGGSRALGEARRRADEPAAAEERLSLPAAAALARCSPMTLALAVKRRDIPCTWDKQGRRFFDAGDVLAWARARGLILVRYKDEGPALAAAGPSEEDRLSRPAGRNVATTAMEQRSEVFESQEGAARP